MKDENSILRKIERCEALSKSPNGNEAAVAYKQMQALINKYSTPYKASQINFKTGDKVVYIEPSRTDSVLTIKSMITGDHLRHPVALMGGTYGCGVIMLRHATDEEIKVGKRLEVS